MTNKLFELLSKISGYVTLNEIPESKQETVEYSELIFKINQATYRSQQVKSNLLTINVIKASFEYPSPKRLDKQRLYSSLDEFNSSKVAIKACLTGAKKGSFVVTFSTEFVCPDDQLTEQMLYPAVHLLGSSGGLFLAQIESTGLVPKSNNK